MVRCASSACPGSAGLRAQRSTNEAVVEDERGAVDVVIRFKNSAPGYLHTAGAVHCPMCPAAAEVAAQVPERPQRQCRRSAQPWPGRWCVRKTAVVTEAAARAQARSSCNHAQSPYSSVGHCLPAWQAFAGEAAASCPPGEAAKGGWVSGRPLSARLRRNSTSPARCTLLTVCALCHASAQVQGRVLSYVGS